MPSAVSTKEQIEECLRRVTEAEQYFQQMAAAQTALQSARKILGDLHETPKEEPRAVPQQKGTNRSLSESRDEENEEKIMVVPPCDVKEEPGDMHLETKRSQSQKSICKTLLDGAAEEIAAELGIKKDDVVNCYLAFCEIDKNCSGKISVSEMTVHLSRLLNKNPEDPKWQGEVEKLVMKYDTHEDNKLDFEEFLFLYSNTETKKQKHLAARVSRDKDRLSYKCRVNCVGVRSDTVTEYLVKEIKEERSFLVIPIIFALFCVFAVSVSFHRKTSVLNAMAHAVRFDIEENANFAFGGAIPFENGRMGHKNVYDVNNFADFWSWMDLGAVPLLFPQSWDVSETRANIGAFCTPYKTALSLSDWESNDTSFAQLECTGKPRDPIPPEEFFNQNTYLFFNSIVGGVRLSQEHDGTEPCAHQELFGHAYDNVCVKHRGRWVRPDYRSALDTRESLMNHPDGETIYLLSKTDQTVVRRELRDLENKAWLNQKTQKVEVLFTMYNAHNDVFMAVYVNFFLTSAGHIHKGIKVVPTWLSPYSDPACYFFDAIWALLVLQVCWREFFLLRDRIVRFGMKGGLEYHFFRHSAAVVNMISILYSFFLVVIWIIYVAEVSELKTLLVGADADIPGSWSSSVDLHAFYEQVDKICKEETPRLQTVLAIYPFLIGLRFFSAFSGQPRLAVVTETLRIAFKDLLHFGIVLTLVLLCFVVSGEIFFGAESEDFQNFTRSCVAVLRALIGEWDYEQLVVIDRPAGNAWLCTFIILLNLVMFNMLLAIVMDVYGTVKGALDEDAETVWSQTWEIYRRWRQKRLNLRVSLPYVHRSLERANTANGYDNDRLLTVAELQEMTKGLTKKQAEHILIDAESWRELHNTEEISVQSSLRKVNLRIQHLQHSVSKIDGLEHKMEYWMQKGLHKGLKLIDSVREAGESTEPDARQQI